MSPLLTLDDHSGPVRSVDFSSDGRSLISSSKDGLAIVRKGKCIEPAIKLEKDELDLALQSGASQESEKLQLFANVQLITPTVLDLSNATLTVALKDPDKDWLEDQGSGKKFEFNLPKKGDSSREILRNWESALCNIHYVHEQIDANKLQTQRRRITVELNNWKFHNCPDESPVTVEAEVMITLVVTQ